MSLLANSICCRLSYLNCIGYRKTYNTKVPRNLYFPSSISVDITHIALQWFSKNSDTIKKAYLIRTPCVSEMYFVLYSQHSTNTRKRHITATHCILTLTGANLVIQDTVFLQWTTSVLKASEAAHSFSKQQSREARRREAVLEAAVLVWLCTSSWCRGHGLATAAFKAGTTTATMLQSKRASTA